jgi:tetrahydromethanopterin S-methyltransferase subunit F
MVRIVLPERIGSVVIMAHSYDRLEDVEQSLEIIKRGRKLRLALAIAVIVGIAIAGLVFAQISAGPGVPYGY